MLSILTRVPATKLDSWVTHVRNTLTVLLVTQIHAVRVPVAAPTQGDAQTIHSALKLIRMTTSRGTGGYRETLLDSDWHCCLSVPLVFKSGRATLKMCNIKTTWNKKICLLKAGRQQVLATAISINVPAMLLQYKGIIISTYCLLIIYKKKHYYSLNCYWDVWDVTGGTH